MLSWFIVDTGLMHGMYKHHVLGGIIAQPISNGNTQANLFEQSLYQPTPYMAQPFIHANKRMLAISMRTDFVPINTAHGSPRSQ